MILHVTSHLSKQGVSEKYLNLPRDITTITLKKYNENTVIDFTSHASADVVNYVREVSDEALTQVLT